MTTLSIQVDEKVEKEAEKLFSDFGLDISTAVNIFLRQSINQDGTLLYILNLRQDRTLTVTGPAGENIITVADGEVFISRADCPDQICVQHGPLQKTGGPIICLPNRLTIEWAQKDAQVDALSGTGGLP